MVEHGDDDDDDGVVSISLDPSILSQIASTMFWPSNMASIVFSPLKGGKVPFA